MIGNDLSEVAWEFLMRRLLVAGFIAVAAQGAAFAADLPILRGAIREPAPVCCQTVWQGFYVGGQAGYGSSSMGLEEFSPVPTSSATWPILTNVTHRASMFGGFAGYNAQYENVVLGFEGNYMHGTFTGVSSAQRVDVTAAGGGATLTRTFRSDGAMTVKDFGTLRVRGGYTMGNFMPYLFAGFGLGRADTSRAMTLTGVTDFGGGVLSAPRVTTIATDTNNQFVHGFAAGGGLDWMVFGGLFVRAEYEYLQFTSTLNTSIHSFRGGVGYKF
jgi:outer membrane immunogenic protein